VDLGLSTRVAGDNLVIAVSGELDVFTAPTLDDLLAESIEAGSTNLIVDLTEVTFLDSTGLGSMVKGLKRARERGGSLRVVASSDRIVKVFKITGLDQAMALTESLSDIVDS
jgi:anti-sigma B factor antagonist